MYSSAFMLKPLITALTERLTAAEAQIASLTTKFSALTAGPVTLISPNTPEGAVILVQGDDYAESESRAVSWRSSTWPDLAGAAVTLTIIDRGTGAELANLTPVITTVDADQVATVELTAALTNGFALGVQSAVYTLTAVLANTNTVTLASGYVEVRGPRPDVCGGG